MTSHTFRSDQLLKNSMIIMCLMMTSVKIAYTHHSRNNARGESLKSVASETVEKILNVPVNLNFNDEPLIRRGRGFYGGHRRNDDFADEKINDGQFGARIILGIVENPDKTTAKPAVPDQKKSQTIVKYFDKEDYGGIKTKPIVVADHYAEDDADQIEKTRNRKEILDLRQQKSPLIDDEQHAQKNEDYSHIYEDKDDVQEEEPKDVIEHNKKIKYHQGEDHDEEDEYPSAIKQEKTDDSEKYSTEYDSPIQKYEEKKVPSNHKETYKEIEYSNSYDNVNEEPIEELKQSDDLPVEKEKEEDTSDTYIAEHKKAAESSDVKEEVTQKDQKGSGDNSHEEIKQKKKKGGKHASGKGEEHHEEHHGKKGEKGVKKYKGYHEEVKKKKGHHDEEKHGKKYADKGGEEKKQHEEHGHHGDYHKGEKGEKGSEFSEEGKHSKGHSTKGEHNIHKKDEYEKKQEFYDEHHEGGEHEKHGAFHHDDEYEKGGHTKGGHHKKGDHNDHYGKKSHHEEGHFYDEKDGKKKASGHKQHHSHNTKHGKKVGNSGKKHWGYQKGTGDGGKKKHNEGQHAAHSNPQQIKKIPPDVHGHYREENGKYPHYISRIHIHNDKRRSDTVQDKDDIVTNQSLLEKEENEESKTNHEIVHLNSKEAEIPVQNAGKYDTNVLNNYSKKEEDIVEDKESSHDYLPQSSNLHEKNINSKKKTSKPLPKIYVILPKDFEEQLERSAESSESSSIEKESSYEDSEEEQNDPKMKTIHKKYTKVIEPVEAQSFPEEHKKKLSEIEYVVHKIGSELEKNIKNKNSQLKTNNQARRGKNTEDKHSESSEEYQ
ncbi:sarcoplasmic reticulum histidine-rich calcium-binding protein-like [Coccinella septempunctata]|uniref:sarcoplasmic reticulum histidine-rich calcium-binding protein-like n=1 Tax=Coccinella septempunctata TaxID=41139 RepID=UPI001D091E46|nr:sarcoplasmic reticulum histidine-rich calcium-binding protein-like [Coccinella septempunctata]